MAVTTERAAPYAPASAILEIINRFRNRGLPSPITSDVLGRVGVSQSLIPRTLQALQTLELIDESGAPTQVFENIRLAPEPEYQQRLEEWLNTAYAEVITLVDPSSDDETRIRDAFRSYQPVGQQPRMVSLFLGLYAAAGKAPERPSRTPRPSREPRHQNRSRAKAPPSPKFSNHTKQRSGNTSDIPAPILGLLSSLPQAGQGWTQREREKFAKTFAVVLDYCFPIVEDNSDSQTATGDDPTAA